MFLSIVSVKRDLSLNRDRIKVSAGLFPFKEASAFLEYLEQNPQLTAKAAFRKLKTYDPAGYSRRCYPSSSLRSLDDLNARFHTWLESEYHRSPHRGLGGKTPLETWIEKAHYIIHLDPTVNVDEIFKHELRRRVYSDCTFTLDGVLYEVPAVLKGKNIKIRFNPFQAQRKLELLYENRNYGEARVVDTYANTKVKRSQYDDPDLRPKPIQEARKNT